MMTENKEQILSEGNREPREACLKIIEHVLESIDPCEEIRKSIDVDDEKLYLFDRAFKPSDINNVYVIGAGKASFRMARESESILSERIEKGVVVTKYGYKEEPLDEIEVIEAGHPVPDESGMRAGEKILEVAREVKEGDLVISLISGGGSALLCAPVDSVSLGDMRETTDLLVSCGAAIDEINSVRKHLSKVKGGNLARTMHPAHLVSLIVSDVVGDRLDVIASGPTVPDNSTFDEAYRTLDRYNLLEEVPSPVRTYLCRGMEGEVEENPKTEDFKRIGAENIVISSNDRATEAAEEKGKDLGLDSLILSRMIEGESREVGIFVSGILRDIIRTGTPLSSPALLISGGETTVTLGEEGGEGGPNQEFVLAAASKISGLENVGIAAMDTDGTDGPTDIAGGLVDGTTEERLAEKGLELSEALDSHDSKPALEKINDAIRTGPTGTNVNDLRIAVVL